LYFFSLKKNDKRKNISIPTNDAFVFPGPKTYLKVVSDISDEKKPSIFVIRKGAHIIRPTTEKIVNFFIEISKAL
jgi:hypothetical protein